jgi:hypothetical protein
LNVRAGQAYADDRHLGSASEKVANDLLRRRERRKKIEL